MANPTTRAERLHLAAKVFFGSFISLGFGDAALRVPLPVPLRATFGDLRDYEAFVAYYLVAFALGSVLYTLLILFTKLPHTSIFSYLRLAVHFFIHSVAAFGAGLVLLNTLGSSLYDMGSFATACIALCLGSGLYAIGAIQLAVRAFRPVVAFVLTAIESGARG